MSVMWGTLYLVVQNTPDRFHNGALLHSACGACWQQRRVQEVAATLRSFKYGQSAASHCSQLQPDGSLLLVCKTLDGRVMRELCKLKCQFVFRPWGLLHESAGAQKGLTFWETPG